MRMPAKQIALLMTLALGDAACAVPAPSPSGFAAATAVAAQQPSSAQPRIRNSQFTTRAAGPSLEREFRAAVAAQSEPAWIGYAVPAVHDRASVCCGSWRNDDYTPGCCRMEHDDGVSIHTSSQSEPRELAVASLEPALFVFYRAAGRQVGNIRVFSADCELDAGGLPVIWLTGVRPEQSVALLGTFVRAETDWSDRDDRSAARRAITAIALHAGSAADQALERMAAANQPEELRRQVTFWLGEARGAFGYSVLSRMLRDDPSDKVREKAIFGLHVSDEPQALDAIIAAARDDRSKKVRSQALFWLGQKAGKKAAAAITAAIENDPETDVKRRAVFALSQMPKDEGVPLLIQVARSNRNPAVRKQAMFWLGQTGDPRALAFFEEVLKQ